MISSNRVLVLNCFLAILIAFPASVFAQSSTDDTTITLVAVNGGNDTANPGTSCLKVSNPVSASCTAGYVAIPNNNVQLLATALRAKAANNRIWLYYNESGNFHCPGIVFTPCNVISIMVR
jgi:hypothetical protein